tara:strand:- start:14908 stop:15816 length:909 start_codon:yes stop_codon:yes gene_type:complete
MEYSFSKINSHKVEQLNWFDLFIKCFGPRPLLDDKWYFWHNTSYKHNNTYVVKLQNKIVASYSLYPITVKYKNVKKDGYLCHNVMTDPDHGGRGLFTQLGKYAISCTPSESILIGVPNENAIRGHMKVGWSEYSKIPFYIKNNFENHTIEDVEEIQSFSFSKKQIEKFNESYDFCVVKDADYLNWRYINRPNIKYDCYKLSDDSGFIVLKRYEEKLHIIDYGFNNYESFTKLLKFTENKAKEINSEIIEFWCYSINDQDILKNLGFKQSETLGNRLILLANPEIKIDATDNFKIVLGDNDVF